MSRRCATRLHRLGLPRPEAVAVDHDRRRGEHDQQGDHLCSRHRPQHPGVRALELDEKAPQRIENAMNEAGVHIDPIKSVNGQVREVVEALRPLLPISFEKVRVAVKLQASDQGKCFGDMKT